MAKNILSMHKNKATNDFEKLDQICSTLNYYSLNNADICFKLLGNTLSHKSSTMSHLHSKVTQLKICAFHIEFFTIESLTYLFIDTTVKIYPLKTWDDLPR